MKFLFTLLLGAAALAQAETNAERGKRIVAESLAALGGDNYLAMQDRLEDGRAYSFYRDRMTGLAKAKVATRYLSGPGKSGLAQRERQTFGKDEDYLILFTEDRAYQVTFRGAQPLPDERWERYVRSTRSNILYIMRHRLKEPGLIIESRGTDVWLNTPVEIVDITDSDNNVVTVYFHSSTKLPVRQHWTVRNPETKERDDFVTIYSKYRDVGGGVQWPYNIVSERNGDKTFEMFSDSVTINKGMSDEMFTLSASTRILEAER